MGQESSHEHQQKLKQICQWSKQWLAHIYLNTGQLFLCL